MSDIEDLLARIRDEDPGNPTREPRNRLAVATGIVGATAVVLCTGMLASGAVAGLAAPREVTTVVSASEDPTTTPTAPEPVSSPIPSAPEPESIDELPLTLADGTPLYSAATDISTVPLPADQPDSEIANAKVWLTQQSLIAHCLDDQGYVYGFSPYWLRAPGTPSLDDRYRPRAGTPGWTALYGADDQPSGDDYDWRQAGCTGYAVHATGMDGAH